MLEEFRAGTLNTLISTAVAEEGLDLTRCALVRPVAAPCPPAAPRSRSEMLPFSAASSCEHPVVCSALRPFQRHASGSLAAMRALVGNSH